MSVEDSFYRRSSCLIQVSTDMEKEIKCLHLCLSEMFGGWSKASVNGLSKLTPSKCIILVSVSKKADIIGSVERIVPTLRMFISRISPGK